MKGIFLCALGFSFWASCAPDLQAQDKIEQAAITRRVKVLEVSSSGKSMMIDRGEFEQIEVGDKAKFVLQEGPLDKPKLSTVAYGEAIKSHGTYSYWLMNRVLMPEALKPDSVLLFVSMRNLFSGRQPFRIKQEKIILAPRDPRASQDKNMMGQRKDLVHLERQYSTSRKMVTTVPTRHHHLETKNKGIWQKSEGKKSKGRDSEYQQAMEGMSIDELEKVVEGDLVREQVKDQVFASSTEGAQGKVNEQKLGLGGLYHKQRRDPDISEMQAKGSFQSVFEEKQEKKLAHSLVDERALEKMRNDGKFWSGDMNDKELEDFFVKGQLAKEVKRRRSALEHRSGHEILFRIGKGLTQSTTSTDPSYQSSAKSLELGYEFHLMRSSTALEKFSAEAFVMQGLNYYDMGGINGKGTEKAFQLGLNWYILNDPTIMDSYMGYVGFGYRSGSSKVETSNVAQTQIKYSLKALPILHRGRVQRALQGGGGPHQRVVLRAHRPEYRGDRPGRSEWHHQRKSGKIDLRFERFLLGRI